MPERSSLLLIPVREAESCTECGDPALLRLQPGGQQPGDALCRWCALAAAGQRADDYETAMVIQQSIHSCADELEHLAATVAFA